MTVKSSLLEMLEKNKGEVLSGEYGGNWLYQAVTEKKECDTYMGENVLQEKKEIE